MTTEFSNSLWILLSMIDIISIFKTKENLFFLLRTRTKIGFKKKLLCGFEKKNTCRLILSSVLQHTKYVRKKGYNSTEQHLARMTQFHQSPPYKLTITTDLITKKLRTLHFDFPFLPKIWLLHYLTYKTMNNQKY